MQNLSMYVRKENKTMKFVLINTSEIENCWETKDACLITMKSGKTWVCSKNLTFNNKTHSTYSFIENTTKNKVSVPLISGGAKNAK